MSLCGRALAEYVQGSGLNPRYFKIGEGKGLKIRKHKSVNSTKMCTPEFYELLRYFVSISPQTEKTFHLFSKGQQDSEVSWKTLSFHHFPGAKNTLCHDI